MLDYRKQFDNAIDLYIDYILDTKPLFIKTNRKYVSNDLKYLAKKLIPLCERKGRVSLSDIPQMKRYTPLRDLFSWLVVSGILVNHEGDSTHSCMRAVLDLTKDFCAFQQRHFRELSRHEPSNRRNLC